MPPVASYFSKGSFSNILELERAKGFTNTSVIGGLDKFIRRWRKEITVAFPNSTLVRKLLCQIYDEMTNSQREKWVSRWSKLLEPPSAVVKSPKTPNVKSSRLQKSPSQKIAAQALGLDGAVTDLRGVDTKTTAKLSKLGITTIRDALYLFPRRHNDYTQGSKVADLGPETRATIIATVWEARQVRLGRSGNLKATEAIVGDETGNIRVLWFGQAFLARQLVTGTKIALSGNIEVFNKNRVLQSPDYDIISGKTLPIHTGRLVPIYPLTEGLSARNLRRIMWQAVENWTPHVSDFMPKEVLEDLELENLPQAIAHAHFPPDLDSCERARRRLAFDELFILQTAVLMHRRDWQQDAQGIAIKPDRQVVANFINGLPFQLTGAQERCLEEILQNMATSTPAMSRLLQGEVGSGKTVVALASLLAVARSGHQGSIMVPTEVLAEQHFHTVCNLMDNLAQPVQEGNLFTAYLDSYQQPISVALVTGSTKKSLKRELQQRASEGSLDIIIGTHTLIQEDMEIPNLALAVVDEQHRFGVMQRAALRGKGGITPHMLLMSATPIPRTLALTLYGDLDISTIDELPPGRQKIATRWVSANKREAAYAFLRKQVLSGRQAFVICPFIEESEVIEAKAATEEYERLSHEIFPDLRLGLLHGRLTTRQKEAVMTQFYGGELDILVATPVVEVGIDVANATVMMVEAADRFGLSQLHQFRGRVGRGNFKSYCLLLAEDPSDLARERLSAIEQIHDGFKLAEVDLSLRGPGDFFGTRQSGRPSLRMAQLSDRQLLGQAREKAAKLLQNDPDLSHREHQPLAREVARFQGGVSGEAN